MFTKSYFFTIFYGWCCFANITGIFRVLHELSDEEHEEENIIDDSNIDPEYEEKSAEQQQEESTISSDIP